ncbi:pilus assembly protein [Thiohalorhabdus methylotrophus]|uniref:Pilus assembly protein n=1 Tax=Thiohalorhabdus methylotrophus TaxID=3242694 RepID=A0ABV4TZ29_9GAMM
MGSVLKRLAIGCASGAVLGLPVHAVAQSMSDYCYENPAIGTSVKPNIMLMLDSSGSMEYMAYNNGPAYDSSRTYYGYADVDACYTEPNDGTNTQDDYEFVTGSSLSGSNLPENPSAADCGVSGSYSYLKSGNYLNYLEMERIDVARKALMGGKTSPRISSGKDINTYITEEGDTFTPSDASENKNPSGIIQDVANEARWGVAVFGKNADGAEVKVDITKSNLTDTYTGIENWDPGGNTPLAEALWSLSGYFAQTGDPGEMPDSINAGSQEGPRYGGGDYSVNDNSDPLNYGSGGSPEYASCADSFVLYVTDGAPTADEDTPSDLHSYNSNPSTGTTHDSDIDHSGYLEDVGFYARVNDFRSSSAGYNEISGDQNLILYPLYAFGSDASARDLLKKSAVTGGFEDLDGDGVPYYDDSGCSLGSANSDSRCAEWDEDGDGDPDNYFEAQDGSELESKLRQAITAILERASSGSTVATISTQTRSGGTLLQAYYLPQSTETGSAGTYNLSWKGYLRSLWTDPVGNLRNDAGSNDDLVLDEDKILQFFFDTGDQQVKATLFPDDGSVSGSVASDNVPDTCDAGSSAVTTKPNVDVAPLWEVGEELAARDPGDTTDGINANTGSNTPNRDIWFNYNGGDSSLSAYDSSRGMTRFDATSAVASALAPYWDLGAGGTPNSAEDLIKYLRGYDNPNGNTADFRLRQAENASSETAQDVWKLGAVVTSTPRVLRDQPVSRYADGQETYNAFSNSSAVTDRESMVFVGANDGMLHAFYTGEVTEGSGSTQATLNGSNIGEEAWAFIPENALPYLRWYHRMDSKCMVPTVDYRVQLVDAAIGAPADGDVSGTSQPSDGSDWRTLLVGTMGFGGQEISCGDIDGDGSGGDLRSSSLFVLDITNPQDPAFLWEQRLPDSSLTLTYPSVVRRASDNGDNGNWYLVLGSGPMDPEATSFAATPKLFVYDLRTGGKEGEIDLTSSAKFKNGNNVGNNADVAVGEPLSLDPDQDDLTDSVYFGTYGAAGSGLGSLYRLHTQDNANPANWMVSRAAGFSGGGRAVFAAPGVARDSRGNVWVYGGTGRFLGPDDKTNNADPQYLFGYIDDCWGDGVSDSATCGTGVTVENDLVRVDEIQVTGTASQYECRCGGTYFGEATESGGTYSCPSGADLVVTGTDSESYSGGTCGGTLTCSGSGDTAFEKIRAGIESEGGWYRALTGEMRIFSQPTVQSGLVNALGFTPDTDICGFGGTSQFIAVDYRTGTPPARPVFLSSEGFNPEGNNEISAGISLGKGVPPLGEGFAAMPGSGEGEVKALTQTSTGQVSSTSQQGQQMRSGILFVREP